MVRPRLSSPRTPRPPPTSPLFPYTTLFRSRHAAGVRRVLPYLGKPVEAADLLAMAGAYRSTLALLDRHAPAIAEVLDRLPGRSEEHTSELQSRRDLVCRLLLEKKNKKNTHC